jgi:hypothetical protein
MIAADMSMRQDSDVSTVEAAKKMKVSRDSVQVAKKIKQASSVLAKRVRDGKLSLNAAELEIET